MDIVFTSSAWEDYNYWQQTDSAMVNKINSLIKEITRTPFLGTGKPEALKHEFSGCWSRRINQKHRLIYKVDGTKLSIVGCRYHYK